MTLIGSAACDEKIAATGCPCLEPIDRWWRVQQNFPNICRGGNICNIVTVIYLREIGVNCVASFENSGGAGHWQITDYTPAAP